MIDLELGNFRVADETTLGRASISGQEVSDHSREHENNFDSKKLIEPESVKKTPFNDLFFAQLEDVGDEDVLFEGIDDDCSQSESNKEEEEKIKNMNYEAKENKIKPNKEQQNIQDKLEDQFKIENKSRSLRMVNDKKIHDPYYEIQRYCLSL